MKINNNIPADLIAQIQEAAQPKPSSTNFASSMEGASTSPSGPVSGAEAPDPIAQEAKTTARLVIDGKINSVEEARNRVLNAVIDSQTDGFGSAREQKKTRETLRLALADDPVLANEIDRALLLAASELAE